MTVLIQSGLSRAFEEGEDPRVERLREEFLHPSEGWPLLLVVPEPGVGFGKGGVSLRSHPEHVIGLTVVWDALGVSLPAVRHALVYRAFRMHLGQKLLLEAFEKAKTEAEARARAVVPESGPYGLHNTDYVAYYAQKMRTNAGLVDHATTHLELGGGYRDLSRRGAEVRACFRGLTVAEAARAYLLPEPFASMAGVTAAPEARYVAPEGETP